MNRPRFLMACGHVDNGTCNGEPACVICGCRTPVREVLGSEGMDGRKAKCSDCKTMVDSKWTLPFFKHSPDQPFDRYYCGCRGWD